MATKRPPAPGQRELFGGTALDCPGIGNLPLIVDSHCAGIEVLAPGSVYQPLLLKPRDDRVDAGPGTLDLNEEAFVRDLILRLYPAGNHPKGARTPLKWGAHDLWLKRNIEKRNDSFRLRVGDSDWFYPDFIVWILDYERRIQTFGFVDPKGLAIGAGAGWSDYKMVATLYMPHVVERQLATSNQQVVYAGEPWTFRVRGVLLSTSSYEGLTAQAKFAIRDETGQDVNPTMQDFGRGRVLFPRADRSHIDDILRLLTQDTELDPVLALAAAVLDDTSYFTPEGELQHEVALRRGDCDQPECTFIGALLRDYLRADAQGRIGASAIWHRQRQLMDYAQAGHFGIGGEKATVLRDHPTPCAELWRRKHQATAS
ncbi:hypothetical protein [uncultured Thiodictyon sp.]|uniref:hypothetical protein n=1 Tax=uncultured Thiodictyon sp. TaxID=1846217 RepID=UPI0025FCBF90|nr:hypothetical protein [uncultured Thiodictyon sp.]